MMEYTFSDCMAAMQPSAIREIFKNTADPSVIPFAGGNPSPDAFPSKELENIVKIIFNNDPVTALQYSVTEGYPLLRDATLRFVQSREPGLTHDVDDILITTGAQQAIDLATKCLLNAGDTIICESPSFIGALNAFRVYQAHLVGVELEADGIHLGKLEEALQANPNTKLIYLIPNFQNPTGITMSLEKRRAVYDLARRYHVMILEDNPYGDLRYDGAHIPAIKTLDQEGLVIYCGTFSKIVAPGLRVGYAIAPRPLIGKMVVAKQCSDVHTPILNQMICGQFLQSCNIPSHLAGLQKLYRAKCTLMTQALDDSMGGRLAHTSPQGGLFLWCTLPPQVDLLEFVRTASAQKVAVVPGSTFLLCPGQPCSSFRMNFSAPTFKQITDGVEILSRVLTALLHN